MSLNAILCSKCRLFVHQSLNEHFKNLMMTFTASQQLNLDINTTVFGRAGFLSLFEYFTAFHPYNFMRINRKLKN